MKGMEIRPSELLMLVIFQIHAGSITLVVMIIIASVRMGVSFDRTSKSCGSHQDAECKSSQMQEIVKLDTP